MKKHIKYLLLLAFFIFDLKICVSQTPTYILVAKNFNRTAPDSLMFDIYMLHTNAGTANFIYAAGQYFFNFNPNIANGGTLTYKIVDSDLPQNVRPVNPTVTGSQLRLASNALIGPSSSPTISSTSPGTLIVRVSLKTSASSFDQSQQLNLAWRNSSPTPYTRIYTYIGILSTEISTPSTHTIEDSIVSVINLSTEIPLKYDLSQNYPNPFNPSTRIKFDIQQDVRRETQDVRLVVYDVLGKEISTVVNEKFSAGSYEVEFNGANLPSGIYFYKLSSSKFSDTKRMILLK